MQKLDGGGSASVRDGLRAGGRGHPRVVERRRRRDRRGGQAVRDSADEPRRLQPHVVRRHAAGVRGQPRAGVGHPARCPRRTLHELPPERLHDLRHVPSPHVRAPVLALRMPSGGGRRPVSGKTDGSPRVLAGLTGRAAPGSANYLSLLPSREAITSPKIRFFNAGTRSFSLPSSTQVQRPILGLTPEK